MQTSCSCGRTIESVAGTGRPRTKCVVCSPPRTRAAGLAAVPGSGRTAAPRRAPRRVTAAARRVLADIDTDHAAAELLSAVAVRLAQDVDDAAEVRDRVAASKELREVLRELDTAVVPPKVAGPPGQVASGGADEDDDDPFGIADGPAPPAALGDAAAS